MNAFENIIGLYLEESGYWVKQSVKVEISVEDKKKIGIPTMPRPEIDLVAYSAKKNILILIEAKSYLDSPGVRFESIANPKSRSLNRYRLLNDAMFQSIVTKRLIKSFLEKGLINKQTKIKYALAAGNVYSRDEDKIKKYFNKKGWIFISPKEIKEKIRSLAKKGWEDNLVTITAKLILK